MVSLNNLIGSIKNKVETDKDGRIKDESITVKRVLESFSGFTPVSNPKLKDGFTEGLLQKQLYTYLETQFVHVNREQGLEDINGAKIDFDIGRGKVGIEVKLARSLFKTSELQRLVGQMKDYTDDKYNSRNLIILVFGTSEEAKERVYISKIQERVQDIKATYAFIELP